MKQLLTEEELVKIITPLISINENQNISTDWVKQINELYSYENMFKNLLINVNFKKNNIEQLTNLNKYIKTIKISDIREIYINSISNDLANHIMNVFSLEEKKRIFNKKTLKNILQEYKEDKICTTKVSLLENNFLEKIFNLINQDKNLLDPKFLFFFMRNEKYHKKLTKKIIKYWNSNWDQENIIKYVDYQSLAKKDIIFIIDNLYQHKTYEIEFLYHKLDPSLQEDKIISQKCEEKYFYCLVKKSSINTFDEFAEKVNMENIIPYVQWQEMLNKATSINLFNNKYNIIRFMELLIEKEIVSYFDFQSDPSFQSHPFLSFLIEKKDVDFLKSFFATDKGKELLNYSVTNYATYKELETKIFLDILPHLKSNYYQVEINKELTQIMNQSTKTIKNKKI